MVACNGKFEAVNVSQNLHRMPVVYGDSPLMTLTCYPEFNMFVVCKFVLPSILGVLLLSLFLSEAIRIIPGRGAAAIHIRKLSLLGGMW